MNQIIFLLLVVFIMVFTYRLLIKAPQECQNILSLLKQFMPSFHGKHADPISLIFCIAAMIFIGVLVVVLAQIAFGYW